MAKKKKRNKVDVENNRARTTKILSGVGTVALLAAGAIFTPVGEKVTQSLWQDDPNLINNVAWMDNLECDQDPNIAGLPGTAEISGYNLGRSSEGREIRLAAITSLGAVAWYRGKLDVSLTTKTDDPVYIVGVDLVIYARKALTPAWGLEYKEPCGGGATYRLFDVLLDHSAIKDRGVIASGDVTGLGTVDQPPSEKVGRTFTVSRSDPAELEFDVYACNEYYEWGLRISYISGEDKKSVVIGTEGKPFKMIGGYQGVRRYHGDFETSGPNIAKGPQPGDPEAEPSQIPVSARGICK